MLNSKENEKIVLNALKKYGSLEEEQLVQLICSTIRECRKGEMVHIADYPREYALKAIQNLYRKQYIWPEGGIYVEPGSKGAQYWCLSPYMQHDDKLIRAFWLYLKYVEHLTDPDDNFRANVPSEILFLRNNSCHEILVLYPGEENRLKIVFSTNRANGQEEDDGSKFFIIVNDIECVKKAGKLIPEEYRKNVLFATMKYVKGKSAPEFSFYCL